MEAEQLAFVPPLVPLQLQLQGPLPVTVVAVPDEQRSVAGATPRKAPLLLPQTPSTGLGEKAAITFFAPSMATVQAPVPLHAPLQPVKAEPASGVAVRVTAVPEAYDAEQVGPQSIPAEELVTVPVPVPDLTTERKGT
jgi:hypothetical protein